MLTYTVGIRSAYWPFYKKYTVVGHSMNLDIPGSTRLALSLPDGSAIMVPDADKKYFKVFSDFLVRNKYAASLKEQQHNAPEIPAS